MTPDRESLQRQQRALARALTDARASESAHRDASLEGIDAAEILRSAETLIRKRTTQTRSALPASADILGPSFRNAFREFAITHFYNGSDAIGRDATEFAAWVAVRHSDPPWLRDVLRWESERCRWEWRRQGVSLFRLRYAVVSWLASDRREPPERRSQWVVAWRWGDRGGIRVYPRPRSV